MTATERVLDGWSVDVERRARHYAAVIAAAHRAVAEAFDTQPQVDREVRDIFEREGLR